MHKSEIREAVRQRIIQRRGKMRINETLDAARTALVVIDMQNAFMAPGLPSEVPVARDIVPNINRLAATLRDAGGPVVWVTSAFTKADIDSWSSFFGGVYSLEHSEKVIANLTEGAEGHKLWPDLDVRDEDWQVNKTRFSPFIQGASDIEARLRDAGIDTVIITGTLTNVCCESSARDAMMRNFNVVMVEDGNAALTDDDHNGSLSGLAGTFADVITTDEVIAALSEARVAAQ